jgi:hypothetical protein
MLPLLMLGLLKPLLLLVPLLHLVLRPAQPHTCCLEEAQASLHLSAAAQFPYCPARMQHKAMGGWGLQEDIQGQTKPFAASAALPAGAMHWVHMLVEHYCYRMTEL